MRIVWRDSGRVRDTENYKPRTYRGYTVRGSAEGWLSGLPGDANLYQTQHSAFNAIDKALGDLGEKGSDRRKRHGIKVIGKITSETAQK